MFEEIQREDLAMLGAFMAFLRTVEKQKGFRPEHMHVTVLGWMIETFVHYGFNHDIEIGYDTFPTEDGEGIPLRQSTLDDLEKSLIAKVIKDTGGMDFSNVPSKESGGDVEEDIVEPEDLDN